MVGYFIIGEMVKQNQSLTKVKGDIKAKEKELQQINDKYTSSNKYFCYEKLIINIFQTRP